MRPSKVAIRNKDGHKVINLIPTWFCWVDALAILNLLLLEKQQQQKMASCSASLLFVNFQQSSCYYVYQRFFGWEPSPKPSTASRWPHGHHLSLRSLAGTIWIWEFHTFPLQLLYTLQLRTNITIQQVQLFWHSVTLRNTCLNPIQREENKCQLIYSH